MDLAKAKEIIQKMAIAGTGIGFTAGVSFFYYDDLLKLESLCREKNLLGVL